MHFDKVNPLFRELLVLEKFLHYVAFVDSIENRLSIIVLFT